MAEPYDKDCTDCKHFEVNFRDDADKQGRLHGYCAAPVPTWVKSRLDVRKSYARKALNANQIVTDTELIDGQGAALRFPCACWEAHG